MLIVTQVRFYITVNFYNLDISGKNIFIITFEQRCKHGIVMELSSMSYKYKVLQEVMDINIFLT